MAGEKSRTGTVYLVGAGPGDPGLITVRGAELLGRADAVVYDYLANPAHLALVPAEAQKIYVGKKAGQHTLPQEEINALLVRLAREGRTVVRLKGGDPFVFGRGGEEAEVLAEAGVPFEVVPGVTAGVAAPAYAGIPVTHRDHNVALTFITGHEDPAKKRTDVDWRALAWDKQTLCFFMGVGNLPRITAKLIKHGRDPATPVAVIRQGTTPQQRTLTGALAEIATKVERAKLTPPAIVVVGTGVTLRHKLDWYEKRPLFGRRVAVTRTREQASALASALAELGAEVVETPTIRIVPSEDYGPLDRAIGRLPEYDYLVFTSPNGVTHFWERLAAQGQDARWLGGLRLAAIGPATAQALAERGLTSDIVPEKFVAEGLIEALASEQLEGQRILLPRAARAREILPDELRRQGATVDVVAAYRTVPPEGDQARRVFETGVDLVTFTSSSTVTNLHKMLGDDFLRLLQGTIVAAIGPITADTARDLGLTIHIEAAKHTIPGLVQAIRQYFS
ncbi:MAG: uroporphyrinogen-III C-methyltransferase [Proteobacteria bacterium]|nr:uroporphyrinogen-III C-methyltransferase [Pseudomonadota bacterium]